MAGEILKTRTFEMRFPAIWSSNFSCSSGNIEGFGDYGLGTPQETASAVKTGGMAPLPPRSAVPVLAAFLVVNYLEQEL